MTKGYARTFGQDLMRKEYVVGTAKQKTGGGMIVKVSAKFARQPFNGCDPDYIRDVCHASCCESSTSPTGTMITIHPSETAGIEALGGVVVSGLLQPKPGARKCPFKTALDLCGIHFTDAKPFGCIASPFTLNASNTLIVRNRYRLLKCYNSGRKLPAYQAFRASLDLIFGAEESRRICDHLDAGGGDINAQITEQNYAMIKDNDEIKHAAKSSVGLTWVGGNRSFDELDETSRKILAAQPQSGTSIFDPVLCELAYRWFSPPAGRVLDPFAGGSVRGIVAAILGRQYTGIDLRGEQIAANEEQAAAICKEVMPVWITGDSLRLAELLPEDYAADFIFSCPPYGDLETYSDDPDDLSTMEYDAFITAYRAIIAAAVAKLAPNRFACFVVGDFRDKKGHYRGFPSATIAAFEDAGARLYNEAVLVTAVGSLPIRAGRAFESGRKLGKTHQNVLVFVKGDARQATAACGPVVVNADLFSDE